MTYRLRIATLKNATFTFSVGYKSHLEGYPVLYHKHLTTLFLVVGNNLPQPGHNPVAPTPVFRLRLVANIVVHILGQ